jgi:hypothetical protein
VGGGRMGVVVGRRGVVVGGGVIEV